MLANRDEIMVQNVAYGTDPSKFKDIYFFDQHTDHQVGPEFNTLDEKVQQSLLEWIKSLGVNEDLCMFMDH